MSPDIADRLFALLRDGTPGWGSANEGTLQIYWKTVQQCPDSAIAEAAINRIIGEWTSTIRPTVGYLRMTYQAEASRLIPTKEPVEVQCYLCDDTEWVECLDDRRHVSWCRHRGTNYAEAGDCSCHAAVPCPACLTGNPAPAKPEDLRMPTMAEARLTMSQGYAEECERQDREPNWAVFETLAKSLVGRPEHT